MLNTVAGWLSRRADNVAVLLLAATFLLFILQIVFRYVIRQPLGWTLEACLLCWLWLVLWSAAFTLHDTDHVRFTILYDAVRPGVRRIFIAIAALCLVAAFVVSLAPTYDFVSFMAIESTSLLKIPFDWVFSIYLVFAVAIIVRYAWRLQAVMRGKPSSAQNRTRGSAP